MSTTMKMSGRAAAFNATTRRRTEIVLWIAAFIVLAIMATTLAITLGGTEAPASPISSEQAALQRLHMEANAPVTSPADSAQRQAALKRLKEESTAGPAVESAQQ